MTIARERLQVGSLTCVLCFNGIVWESAQRGVKPLLTFLSQGVVPVGAVAADKVVGRAAAFLYVLLGVRALHANIVSRPAADVLERYGITLTYDTMVPAIRNRTDTGFCPMEQAVIDIEDPAAVPDILRATLKKLVK